MNDSERRLWVLNDQGLYSWWRNTRQGITTFIRENRKEITEAINRRLARQIRSAVR